MAILLTTPKQTGDLDSGAPDSEYTHVKIVYQSVDINRHEIHLRTEYGNDVNGMWRAGILPPQHIGVHNIPAVLDGNDPPGELTPAINHYNNLVTMTPTDTTHSVYYHAANILYQWLVDNEYFAGTIV